MRATIVLMALAAGCGERTPAPATPAPAVTLDAGPPDAPSPDAAPPDAEPPVGAVAVPGEDAFWTEQPPLDEVDTTVTVDELAGTTGWPAARRSTRGGEVLLALSTVPEGALVLSVVEDEQGVVDHYALGPAAYTTGHHSFDGDTYPARSYVGDYAGPILFAIRLPDRGVAVWADGATLRVAERRAGAGWTGVLRVRFPRDTTFLAIGTTDPH